MTHKIDLQSLKKYKKSENSGQCSVGGGGRSVCMGWESQPSQAWQTKKNTKNSDKIIVNSYTFII